MGEWGFLRLAEVLDSFKATLCQRYGSFRAMSAGNADGNTFLPYFLLIAAGTLNDSRHVFVTPFDFIIYFSNGDTLVLTYTILFSIISSGLAPQWPVVVPWFEGGPVVGLADVRQPTQTLLQTTLMEVQSKIIML